MFLHYLAKLVTAKNFRFVYIFACNIVSLFCVLLLFLVE